MRSTIISLLPRADALAGTADRDVAATAGASLTYHTEATESPLVRRREQFSGGIGLGYRL